jgi:hypothetical protein
VGPLRLTLPPGERPGFSRQEPSGQEFPNMIDRPGSSQFAEYALVILLCISLIRSLGNMRIMERTALE